MQAGQDPVYLHTDALEDIKAEASVSAASVKTTGIRLKLFAPFNVSRSVLGHSVLACKLELRRCMAAAKRLSMS